LAAGPVAFAAFACGFGAAFFLMAAPFALAALARGFTGFAFAGAALTGTFLDFLGLVFVAITSFVILPPHACARGSAVQYPQITPA
jgi:hypothetical protein